MWWIILIIVALVVFAVLHGKLEKQQDKQLLDNIYKNKPQADWHPNAVALRPSDEYDFEIVGEASYQNNLASIAGVKLGQSKELYVDAIIEAEPNNQHDKNAIRVSIDNRTVGYFDRDTAKEFKREYKKKGHTDKTAFKAKAVIVGGWKERGSEGKYGVKLDIDCDSFGL